MNDDQFTECCPTTAGTYLMKCGESDFNPEVTEVFIHPKYGGLYAEIDVGTYPVDLIHGNLTSPAWMLLHLSALDLNSPE